MSHFTKKGLQLKEGDKVLWDGVPAIVVAVAEDDFECPYRVFSEQHEVSGWVAGEVLELVARAEYEYEEVRKEMELQVGDYVKTLEGRGVVFRVDIDDPEEPYNIGIFGWGSTWYHPDDVTFISRPIYEEVTNEA